MTAVIAVSSRSAGGTWPGRHRAWAGLILAVVAAFLVGQSLETGGPAAAPVTGPSAAGIDAAAVVDTIAHTVRPIDGRPGELEATDAGYRARFHGAGFEVATADGASLGVSLQSAARGGRTLPVDPGTWRGEANVAERGAGPGLREVVTARAGEVEWDVVLDAAPAGRGDLVVTAGLTGAARVEARTDGLRITLDGDGGELLMGELVVVDATGAVVHRAVPEVDDRQLRLVVPDEVVAGADYPLTLDPTVGPEKPVQQSAGALDYQSPEVAFDGTNYLVVWAQGLSTLSYGIRGARVKPDGTVLDPDGFLIANPPRFQGDPDVLFYGPHFLVVWTDHRNQTSDIFGARVTKAGQVLDTLGLAISTNAGSQHDPRLAFDGTYLMVVWTDTRAGVDVYGTRWSPVDGVLDGAGIPITTAAGDQTAPDVIYDGTNYLVVWQDARGGVSSDIYAAVVYRTGEVRDTAGVAFSNAAGDQATPVVASDGTNVLVVWADRRSGTSSDIYGTRWSPVSGLLGTVIPISVAGDDQRAPAVAFNGSFLVVWEDRRSGVDVDIYGSRVTKSGSVSEPSGFLVASSANSLFDLTVIKGSGDKWLAFYPRSNSLYSRSVSPK